MSDLWTSIVIPTHNRHGKLEATLTALGRQTVSPDTYEVVVVDDGSTPPVSVAEAPGVRVVRLEGEERSAARNAGARAARGALLIFIDDDIEVGPGFVAAHQAAHEEWPGALAVGAIRLPAEEATKPFVRFRMRIEDTDVPRASGLVAARNFCAAANMSIARERFSALGGFDLSISSAEDQDFALRHTGAGGRIAFVAEAAGIHRDGALDIRGYCRRHEWGMAQMVEFCRRYPDWPDNVERDRLNGPLRAGREPVGASARKLLKSVVGFGPVAEVLFRAVAVLESAAPGGAALDKTYRLLLGAFLQRGYRKGLRRAGSADSVTSARTRGAVGHRAGTL